LLSSSESSLVDGIDKDLTNSANRTLIPIHCSVAADLTDFDGSWTLFESRSLDYPDLAYLETVADFSAGLMTSVSGQIYDALTHHVSSETANSKRIRQVSFWGIQKGAEVLLDTLRNVVDPVHAQLTPASVG
jgi:distribution and morphology protein 31